MQVRALPFVVPVAVPVAVSWLVVVAVWSTTPLFVFLSTQAFPAELAGGLRMATAALVAHALLRVRGGRLPMSRAAWLTYAAMTPGIFGAMYLTYLVADRVPTGLISVLFGLSPVVTALCARLLATDPLPSLARLGSAVVALAGLVFLTGASAGGATAADPVALVVLFVAVLLFSVSGVLVRKLGGGLDALAQTTGALWLSLPFYAAAWALHGAPSPAVGSESFTRSLLAIGYLALFGSVLGFVCYYQVLKQMPAASASLITVVTPVFALGIGALFNDERLTVGMLGGAALVLLGVGGFLVPATTIAGIRRWLGGRRRLTGGDI